MPARTRGLSPEAFGHRDDRYDDRRSGRQDSQSRIDDQDCAIPGVIDPAVVNRLDLSLTIETEIIPRLLMAHRVDVFAARTMAPPSEILVTPADIETFCLCLVHEPLVGSRKAVELLLRAGMPVEQVIAQVMAPAARHLGVMWEEDRCSFVDVTLGVSRLQQLLRIYGAGDPGAVVDESGTGERRRILLSPVPGEQHTFGLSIVEEHFIRAGWEVATELAISTERLAGLLGGEWFDVLGLSASGQVCAEDLALVIAAARKASVNRALHVVVGGVLFVSDPARAVAFGADSGAIDASDALRRMDKAVPRESRSC